MTTIKMKNELVNKVINSIDNMYDTRNYRYVWNPEKTTYENALTLNASDARPI